MEPEGRERAKTTGRLLLLLFPSQSSSLHRKWLSAARRGGGVVGAPNSCTHHGPTQGGGTRKEVGRRVKMAESYIFICSDRVFREQFPFLFGALRFRNFFCVAKSQKTALKKRGWINVSNAITTLKKSTAKLL